MPFDALRSDRRQLVQGCRHLEVDCWDGVTRERLVVTHGERCDSTCLHAGCFLTQQQLPLQHLLRRVLNRVSSPPTAAGHTCCTSEMFEAVVVAVAQCAFVTSELPVSLSLEMHCSPRNQCRIATMMEELLGHALLS
eukprot:6694389-Prymnesium_polylepis.2